MAMTTRACPTVPLTTAHGCTLAAIPQDRAHAFLADGRQSGWFIRDEDGWAINARWHAHFLATGVPHVCARDAAGHVVQLYRHLVRARGACCTGEKGRRR
jgi:hypothetical protein